MRSWLEIDLHAVQANARALAAMARPATLCAVVKSNAYGHGLIPVARALAGTGIDGLTFAVFAADEAFRLRDAGVSLPILVVGPVDDDELPEAADRRIDVPLLVAEDVRRFAGSRIAAQIKIETGISRFGIGPADAPRVLDACDNAGVVIAGVYSHLANAEDLDVAFTSLQRERLLAAAGARRCRRHIAASAAAILWPQMRLDMVRCGIALFGRWPSEAVREASDGSIDLKPALRWRAPIAAVREVASGESVGYGRDFVASRQTRIAVLPLGYADGLPRAAGDGRAQITIGTSRAPIVGRVCMNACMIDVTDVRPRPQPRDAIDLDIDDVARAAGTIDYEILARLPAHVERRYAS